MDNNTLILVVVVLAAIVILALLLTRNRRRAALRSKFGPEYDLAVDEAGKRRWAEKDLKARVKRVGTFDLHPLSPVERARHAAAWQSVQADFVDDPGRAATRAESLLGEVMHARGYPVSDFEQQAADLSVDHADFVQNYRAAHAIALRHRKGDAGTEDLRQAMIHYRALFRELVEDGADGGAAAEEAAARA